MSDHKIERILDIYSDENLKNEHLCRVNTIEIDKTLVAKSHDYIALFVDLNSKRVRYIIGSKSNQTVVDFVQSLESKKEMTDDFKGESSYMHRAFIKEEKN